MLPFLLHTFPPLIAPIPIRRRAHGISTSLQLPSINAKCWPSNETLITSCNSLHTTKCLVLTSELLSAAPPLAKGSNYYYELYSAQDQRLVSICVQQLHSSVSFGRALSLPRWLRSVREKHRFLTGLRLQFALIADFYIWERKLLEITAYYAPVHIDWNLELQGGGLPAESGKSKMDASKAFYTANIALYSLAHCTSPPYPQPELQNPI